MIKAMKQTFVNLIGVLGYMSLITQWLWATIIVVLPLINNEFFQNLFLPKASEPSQSLPEIGFDPPEDVQILIAVLAVIFSLAMIIYALVSAPSMIGKTGKKITTTSAQKITPVIVKNKKITKKRQKKLSERLTWAVKFTLCIIPLLLLFIPVSHGYNLTTEVIVVSGVFMLAVSLFWFGLQYILARIWKIPTDLVW